MIRIPTDADINTRTAFADVEQKLRELEERYAQDPLEEVAIQINDLKAEIEVLKQKPNFLDYRDVMVGSGPMHSIGLVPDPPAAAGTTKFLREDGTWSLVTAGGTVAAADVTFAATSQVSADDVQEAIDELASTHGLVNIKYIAPGTGNIATALAAGSTGDVFILGAGTYTETTIDVPNALTEFAIIGQGPGSTTINISGGGIGINAADVRRNKAVIQGFTMQPTTQNATWGIKVWGRSQNSYVNPHILIRNVTIQRSMVPYWFTGGGFWLENCFEAIIENCSFRNKPSDYVGTGFFLESSVVCNVITCRATETESAFKTDRCTDYTRVENAVSDGHTTHHGTEGSRFIGCESYICKYGWYAGTRTLDCMFIDGTLAVCTDNGVTDGGATILGLEGYNTLRGTWVDGMTASGASGCGLQMQGWKILGNTFNGPNDTSKNTAGVAFTADSADRAQVEGNNVRYHDFGIYNNGADNCLFTNNVFENMTANDTGIYILSGGNSNICVNNQYYNSPGYTDGGTSNIFSAVPAAHAMESAGGYHTASGLTTGHVLKATGAAAFAFGALGANQVTNTAAGNIVATDVQAAINELDSEKAALAGATFTGDVSFSSATASKPAVSLINTNADASGPYLILQKDSASPAASDAMGTICYRTDDSGGTATDAITLVGTVLDTTDSSEDARLDIYAITGGSTANPASITGSTAASTTPAPYAYFKPITAKYRADSSSSTYLVWDTTVAADSKFSVASTTNVTVSEAGTYHVSVQVTLTLNNAAANIVLQRFNSSNSAQEQTNYPVETSANRSTAGTISETFVCAAGDYFKVSHDAGSVTANDVYNQFSIQRLN